MRHWVTMTEIFHSFWSRQQFDKRSSDLISETHSRRWKLWPPLTPSSLISETYYKIPGPRMHLIFLKGDQAQNDLGFMVDQAKWVCKSGYLLNRQMGKKSLLCKNKLPFGYTVFENHPKCLIYFLFLHFPRIFVQLKKIKSKVNVARFARNVEWDFFFDFQTLWVICWREKGGKIKLQDSFCFANSNLQNKIEFKFNLLWISFGHFGCKSYFRIWKTFKNPLSKRLKNVGKYWTNNWFHTYDELIMQIVFWANVVSHLFGTLLVKRHGTKFRNKFIYSGWKKCCWVTNLSIFV